MYQKFKDAEQSLQTAVESLGYSVKIEPVAALDLFYSDGLVSSCYGKAVFIRNTTSITEYQIFFPYYCLNLALPEEIKKEFDKWVEQVMTIKMS